MLQYLLRSPTTLNNPAAKKKLTEKLAETTNTTGIRASAESRILSAQG
jgi:hypothetical protein